MGKAHYREHTINTSTSLRALIAVLSNNAVFPHPGGDATSTTIRCLTPPLFNDETGAKSRSMALLPVDQPEGAGEAIACCRRRAAADWDAGAAWDMVRRGPAAEELAKSGNAPPSQCSVWTHLVGILPDGAHPRPSRAQSSSPPRVIPGQRRPGHRGICILLL